MSVAALNSIEVQATARLIRELIGRLHLSLEGRRVLTEGATGSYVAPPVIAAAAGAQVVAFTRATRFGSVEEVRRQTGRLAEALAVQEKIEVVDQLTESVLSSADIVTNSGHLRPLDARRIACLKPGAVIPLMYEGWEFRSEDLDLDACRQRGIAVAGTNEQHPDLRVFDYLGMLAICGLIQSRIPVSFARLLLVCDNPFASYIAQTLAACEAEVYVLEGTSLARLGNPRCRVVNAPGEYDAVIVADTPGERPVLGRKGAAKYAVEQLGIFRAMVQVWGDVDRPALGEVLCWPPVPPAPGHMGVQLSDLGPEPIVRLQAGGLKVGEVLCKRNPTPADLAYCQPVAGSESV